MVKQFYGICKLIIISSLIVSLVSCSEDDGSEYVFKYDVNGNPQTLDPQKAVGETASLVITNLFDGLLKLDGDGGLIPAVAGEYMISDDGLIYTFYLREDIYWYAKNGFSAKCTANDFVFGFARLFNPAVKSENADKFFCIKNSEKVKKGEITDIDEIGVYAVNDSELVIELDYPNPDFLYLLTTAPAMPCNEEFYEKADGRYGLVAEGTPSNGSFYLEKWSYDEYSNNNNNMILRRNKKNSESNTVYPYGLNFFINEEDELGNFLSGASHSIILSGDDGVSLIEQGYPHNDYENSVWGIMFNVSGEFSNSDLRYGLAASINRTKIKTAVAGYRSADKLIPEIVRVNDKSYRAATDPSAIVKYSSSVAKERFENGYPTGRTLDGLTLIMPDDDVIFDYISHIAQQWQAELGFFCKIKKMSENELNNALSSKDYDFAVVKLTPNYNSPTAFFNYFTGSSSNHSNYNSNEYLNYLHDAERAADIEKSIEYYYNAERKLLTDAVFIPICIQTEYFIYSKKCSDIIYNPFTRTIDYKEAKYK